MGLTGSKEKATEFKRIQHRAKTFDTRSNVSNEFVPLQRAITFDSRMAYKSKLTMQDVLHRRYFNKVPIRQEKVSSVSRTSEVQDKKVVIVVDPFSSGMVLAEHVMDRGYGCVCVYSDTLVVLEPLIEHIDEKVKERFVATLYYQQCVSGLVQKLTKLGYEYEAVIAGAETGNCS